MDLDLFKIVVNASLFILIWIVQIVVYPGFNYYNESDLKKWHRVYTKRISFLVLPLMLSQLLVYLYSSVYNPVFSTVLIFALILINWVITFFVAVPLHNAIDERVDTSAERRKLVSINWVRTFNWTIIFTLSILYYGK
ncbi:MAG: DUF1772 domain-containing protein [Chitinophagales bacterium]|nr:DUF1772 domain-containing protein [Chitinophagales bacterium]